MVDGVEYELTGHGVPHGGSGRPLPPHPEDEDAVMRAASCSRVHRLRAACSATCASSWIAGSLYKIENGNLHAARLRAAGRRRLASWRRDRVRRDLPGPRALRRGGRATVRAAFYGHRRGRAQARARPAVVSVARRGLAPVRQEQDGDVRAVPHRREGGAQGGEEPVLLASSTTKQSIGGIFRGLRHGPEPRRASCAGTCR